MSTSAVTLEEVGSDQIRSALDQLTYVKRLLQGDQDLSLEDLLSSANAAQIDSQQSDGDEEEEEGDGMIPTGGLNDGLTALLLPLLRMRSTTEQMAGLDNTYEPRKYLTLAKSLARRFGSEIDGKGQAGEAVELANQIGDEKAYYPDKELLLERRKRRRQDGSLGLVDTNLTENVWKEDTNSIESNKAIKRESPRSTHQFPGQDRSDEIINTSRSEIETLSRSKDSISRDEKIQTILRVWQSNLSQIDAEAAASVQCSTHWMRKNLLRLRVDIDQVGTAILWIVVSNEENEDIFSNQIQIQKINIVSETEMQKLEEDSTKTEEQVVNNLKNLHFSSPSTFPLYRQLRAQILAKVLQSTAAISSSSSTKEETDTQNQWKIFFSTLFALAGLSHIHDPFPNFAQPNQPARGTAAVLSAFAGWDVGV